MTFFVESVRFGTFFEFDFSNEIPFDFALSLSVSGKLNMGSATKIYAVLRDDVVIEYEEWTKSWNTTLKLRTWGMAKLYPAEKALAECTVEDIVTVLMFTANDDDEEKEREFVDDSVDGVFSRFQKLGGNDLESMAEVVEWREKMVEWVRSEGVDGKVIADSLNDGELIEGMKRALVPDDDGTASLDGACGSILNLCRKRPVHGLLAAAKQRAVTRFDALKQYLVQHHDVEEKDIDALNEMVLDGGYESETLALSGEWNPMECGQFIASFIRDRKCTVFLHSHSLSVISWNVFYRVCIDIFDPKT